ncbi:MAG: MFS transporter, partial [Myxococcales bacterium]|nr:MFS transporter [Myxococcales bacterium]
MSERPLSRWIMAGYGVGSIGTGTFATVPGLLLLIYMTDTLGVPAALAGLGIFVPKLWDVVTDPFMGSISDRTESRFGRRRPYLLAGALSLPVCFALIFSTPDLGSPMLAFAWVITAYILAATAFTVFCVPYVAMPAEMSDDYHEATRLMAYRMALMTVGILVAGAGAPMLVKLGGGGQAGYKVMAWAIAAVLLVGLCGAFFGTRSAPFTAADPAASAGPGLAAQLRLALRNRPFVVLLLAYALQLCAVGCLLASVPFFAKYIVAGDPEEMVTFLFVALVGPAIVTMPAWLWVSRRLGKTRAYAIALVIFMLATLTLWWSPGRPALWSVAVVTVMGMAYAATQLFPFSMLPDTIAVDQAATGRRREGIFTGIWTAVDKGGLALGGFATGLILEFSGFVERHGEA